MRFVIDASIAATWCFDDEHDVIAQLALEMLTDRKAVAITPALFWFEVRNAVLIGMRKSRIDPELMLTVLQRVERAPIYIAVENNQQTIFSLALKHRLTFYDAAYLELAVRENLPLATLDKALAAAAKAEGIALIGA